MLAFNMCCQMYDLLWGSHTSDALENSYMAANMALCGMIVYNIRAWPF